MAKASWNGAVLAESDRTVIVEGNQYFPPDSVHVEYFRPSDTQTVCPWKGTASYRNVEVNGEAQRRRRMVLPRSQARRRANQGLRRILEGRARRAVVSAVLYFSLHESQEKEKRAIARAEVRAQIKGHSFAEGRRSRLGGGAGNQLSACAGNPRRP